MNTKRLGFSPKLAFLFLFLLISVQSLRNHNQAVTNATPIAVAPVSVTTVTTTTQSQLPQSIQPISTAPSTTTTAQLVNTLPITNNQPQPQPSIYPSQPQQPSQTNAETKSQDTITYVPGAANPQQSSSSTNQTKNQSNSSDIYRTTIFLISSGGQPRSKLQKYDVNNLNDVQKEVDTFVRGQAQLNDSVNLTNAKGNGKQFIYQYQNNTQNSTQNWAISVSLNEDYNATQDSNSTNKINSSNSSSPQPAEKYVVTGLNFVENIKLSEQEKQKLEDKLRKRQQKIRRQQRQFEQQMQMMRRMDRMNRWQGGYGGFGGSDRPFGRRNYFKDFDDWF